MREAPFEPRLRLRPTMHVAVVAPAAGYITRSGRTSLSWDDEHSVAEIVKRHVKLTVEGIDRVYLNVYAPGPQHEHGIIRFFRYHGGQPPAAR